MYSDKNESARLGTFADFQAIYTAPVSETTDSGNTWMYNIKFGRVIVADVDNCGENEIIVTIRGEQAVLDFKKNTTEYLTMNFNELP